MRIRPAVVLFLVTLGRLCAQVTLNPVPTRALGHPRLTVSTNKPNLIEGREFSLPRSIAADTSSLPHAIYVSDTDNNRVLGWRDITAFSSGARADTVVGQRDLYSTSTLGPGTAIRSGLNKPTGIAVDNAGNLFVVDSGNNRILRYPRPFDQPDELKIADMVIGQQSLDARTANQGGPPGASTINTNPNNFTDCRSCLTAGLAFDSQGNLFFTDAGNHRTLRYPASRVGAGGGNAPEADLVLGQADFTTVANNTDPANMTILRFPAGVAVDTQGRVYVSDFLGRALVWAPDLANGKEATRRMGGVNAILPPNIKATAQSMREPSDLSLSAGGELHVADTMNNRVLVFPRYEDWPADIFPQASRVIGQADFGSVDPNRGQTEPGGNTVSRPSGVLAYEPAPGTLRVLVGDTANNRVLAFDSAPYDVASRVLGQNGFTYSSPNLVEGRGFYFAVGSGIAVDRGSEVPHLYVADSRNHRVLGFRDVRKVRPGDSADIVIGQADFSTSLINYPTNNPNGLAANRLNDPAALAVDAEGNLWVADQGNGRVLRFPKPSFDGGGARQPDADLVIGQLNFTSKAADPTVRTMSAPTGLAFDPNGNLLVSDSTHNRVLYFTKPFSNGMSASGLIGQPSYNTTDPGDQANRFRSPVHIATDTSARIYVADSGNRRISIFGRIGSSGADPSAVLLLTDATYPGDRLVNPVGVFVSPRSGEIWVADSNTTRALRYPKFEQLILNPLADYLVVANGPFAVTEDTYSTLLVGEMVHRIALFYPKIDALNGANFLKTPPPQPLPSLAPGLITSVFPYGIQFTDQPPAGAVTLPLPTELSDTQVLVNDVAAPLFYVSGTQINFVVPMNAPQSGTVELQVVRPSIGQVLASTLHTMNVAAPGIFTIPPSGVGQVAALNYPSNTLNSSTNPIEREGILQMFATGQGFVPGAPPDGHAATGEPTPETPRVLIGTRFADVLYSGLAPGFVGLWQVNVRVPKETAPGPSVPVAILYRDILSDFVGRIRTTIAVK